MQAIIDDLSWRYAVKKFDAKRKINPKDIDVLVETLRLTSTSYGLSPFRVMVVENQEIKDKLKEAAYGQSQPADASHVFILCNVVKPDAEDVENYMQLISKTRDIPREDLDDFAKQLTQHIETHPNISEWSARQVYIALGNFLTVCAMRRIDACPMEGFDSEKFNEILGLNEKGLNAVLAVPAGYRSKDDKYQFLQKVRIPKDEFLIK